MVGVLPLFDPQQIHHSGEGLSDDPDPIVGKAMKLAGLHTFLSKLSTVLPLILLRSLTRRKEIVNMQFLSVELFQ